LRVKIIDEHFRKIAISTISRNCYSTPRQSRVISLSNWHRNI